MSPANGHANDSANITSTAALQFAPPASDTNIPTALTPTAKIKELIADLAVPFHPSVIEWRVTNTSMGGSPRGQVMPYADQRAYTDRLNTLVTPAGWTRRYAVHTSANFQRGKDQRIVAKVLVTCELTIVGVGSHSATGEGWADDDNAGTSSEAQAFKRACSCFGLGRYLYYFTGEWVDLDERKRPKSIPRLPQWATPAGWRQGQRPQQGTGNAPKASPNNPGKRDGQGTGQGDTSKLVRQVEALQERLGNGLYRGLLKKIAGRWRPSEIRDVTVLEEVLEHMQGAKRGLDRLDAALEITGPKAMDVPLRSLKLSSLDRVDNLDALKQIVLAVEEAAAK